MKKLNCLKAFLFIGLFLQLHIAFADCPNPPAGANANNPINVGILNYGSSYIDTKNNAPSNCFGNDLGIFSSDDIFYKFTLTKASKVTLSHCGTTFHSAIILVDADSTVLGFDDAPGNQGCQANAKIEATVKPGTYYAISLAYYTDIGDIITTISVSEPLAGIHYTYPINVGVLNIGTSYSFQKSVADFQQFANYIGESYKEVYYQFTLNTGSRITISNSWPQRYVYLLDVNGLILYYEEGASLSLDLPPGVYYAVTEGSGISSGEITTTITAENMLTSGRINNYVLTNTLRQPITSENAIDNLTEDGRIQQVAYFDGLGRLIQEVGTKASPHKRDIVRPVEYDYAGRELKRYLPYAATLTNSNGDFKTDAWAEQLSFYSNPSSLQWNAPGIASTAYPYSISVYDNSALGRKIEQGFPGSIWQPASVRSSTSGRTILTSKTTNTDQYGLRKVKCYTAVTAPVGYSTSLIDKGYYAVNQLSVTIEKTENWTDSDGQAGSAETYVDKLGRTVLKRTFNIKNNVLEPMSTYYVYNEFGDLSFVLPPGTNADDIIPDQNTLNKLCYQYLYDKRRRLIEKRIPGKGWEYMVYDKLDRPILTQDANQYNHNNQNFSGTKFDALGRAVFSGIFNGTGSYAGTNYRSYIQSNVDGQSFEWEVRDNSTVTGYSARTYQQDFQMYSIINYYDDYNFPGLPPIYNLSAQYSSAVKGLLTATKTKVLNGTTGVTDMLWTVNYYDAKGRVVKVLKQHYADGIIDSANYDEITNVYNDITDELVSTYRIHHRMNASDVSVLTNLTYDHTGRLIDTWKTINGGTPTLVRRNEYNEIGQLMNKKVHSTDNANFLAVCAFTYNERGWLKTQTTSYPNNSVMPITMTLKYHEGTKAQYNGNISGIDWGDYSSCFGNSTYSYDRINRLTKAISALGYNETGPNGGDIEYDKMGNILKLSRSAGTSVLDYVYSYYDTSNQLKQVQGLSSGDNLYDDNGNLKYDAGRAATISYNSLNLPNRVVKADVTIDYIYSAAGEKLRKISTGLGSVINNTITTGYVNGIQYSNSSGNYKIDFIQTEEGRAVNTAGAYSYEYTLADHLGNVRANIRKGSNGGVEFLQVDDYYAFGKDIRRSVMTSSNNYLYNGKELQEEMDEYDYGARFYDPVTARFTTIDPLAEISRRWSPYAYVVNNPIRNIDPDGMTDYYNLGGNLVKHVDDGSTDRLLVLSDKTKASAVDKAISNGEVAAVPSNEVISMMDNAYSNTEATGNEYGFVVATDGSTSSLKTSGSEGSVKLATNYEELSTAGKTSSYDVHTHPNRVDANGNITKVGTANASGTKGTTPGKSGDTDSYGKDGPNNRPGVVLGYQQKEVSINSSGTGAVSSIGGTQTEVKTVRRVGFFDSNGQVGKAINYDDLKKAAWKINGQ